MIQDSDQAAESTLSPPPASTVDVLSTQGISAITRAEIDIQISTAHRFPRSVTKARRDAKMMACADQPTAEGTFYRLKRRSKDGGDNFIEGPSIRMAEIWASCWGNFRSGARIIDIGDKFVTAQGVAHDLETNNCSSCEVQRRITDRNGRRYSDDMIAVTANAACSIALRNAIFRVVPKVYVDQVLAAAKDVAVGQAQSMAEVRTKILGQAAKMGISQEQVYRFCDKAGADDLTGDDLRDLVGAMNAIRDGDATLDDQFPPISQAAASQPTGDKASRLAQSIKPKPAAGPTPLADALPTNITPTEKQ
jgi:hypothetical protein